ncbi:MAG: FadR family transcriptional regulator [Desulfofustis sp.]|jgi:GntR family transcriptional repressor for pyruvate dehydrogenase complex|nr:FadR family transcriptional regulator [Desulfofustis sp.]
MEDNVFRAIEQRKVSAQIVDQVKSLIANGRLKPGDALPPERELMKVFNVSRPTLREALNTLSTMGFVQMAQRRRTRVKSLVPSNITEPLHHLLKEDMKVSLELIESRSIIETGNVRLAAKRATQDDIERLEKCLEKMGQKLRDNKSFTDEDAAFHLAIAEATHNKIQTHLMFSIYDLLKEKVGLCYFNDETDYMYQQHCDIVEAIKARDERRAQNRMEAHLSYVESLLNRLINGEPEGVKD